MERLRTDGWAVATHEGRWFPLGLFAAVAEALDTGTADFPEREPALEVLSNPGPDRAKLSTVLSLLNAAPLAVHFDDFDVNLGADGYVDPGLGEIVDRLCGAAERGRVFVTSRIAPPEPARGRLEMLPLSTEDTAALLSTVAGLAERERETLLQVALATFPLSERDVAAVTEDEDAATTAMRLVELGLVEKRREGFIVTRRVAEAIAPLQGERLADRHERAMMMHYNETHSERRTYSDFVAVTRHLAAVNGMGDLTQFALDLTRRNTDLAAAAALGEVTAVVPAGNGHYLPLRERQITMLIGLGFAAAARETGRRTLRDVRAWAETHPERDPARFCLGAAHNIYGIALLNAGDLAAAEPIFTATVDIYHELCGEHPTSIEAHRRLGWALEHLGTVYLNVDRPDDADTTLRTLAECAHVRSQLFEAQPEPDTAIIASGSLRRLAEYTAQTGDTDNAARFRATRLTMLTAMAATHPDDEELAEELTDALADR
jgi:hypothetical protein